MPAEKSFYTLEDAIVDESVPFIDNDVASNDNVSNTSIDDSDIGISKDDDTQCSILSTIFIVLWLLTGLMLFAFTIYLVTQ